MGRPRKNSRDEHDAPETRASAARDTEQRYLDERDLDADAQISPLHIPKERWPQGQTLRWVRVETQGAIDNKNWSQMTQRGWKPVARGPYEDLFPALPIPGMQDSSGGAVIYGGLVLCARDTRLVERDRLRQERETQAANEAVQPFVEGGNMNFRQTGIVSHVNTSRGTPQFKE